MCSAPMLRDVVEPARHVQRRVTRAKRVSVPAAQTARRLQEGTQAYSVGVVMPGAGVTVVPADRSEQEG